MAAVPSAVTGRRGITVAAAFVLPSLGLFVSLRALGAPQGGELPAWGVLVGFLVGAASCGTASTTTDAPPGPAGEPLRKGRPRVWPSLLAGPLIPLGSGAFAVLVLAVIVIVRGEDNLGLTMRAVWRQSQAFVRSPQGLLITAIAIGGATLAMVAYAASRSALPFVERLALRPPRLRWWAWHVLIAASVAIIWATASLMAAVVGEAPESNLDRLLLQFPPGWLVVAIVTVSVLPAISEESVMRGFVQTRLAQRWGGACAIGVSAVVFAALHGDSRVAAAILPGAIWCGVVAWWTRSTIASMVCHAAWNLTWCLGVAFELDVVTNAPAHRWRSALAILPIALSAGIAALRFGLKPPNVDAGAGT